MVALIIVLVLVFGLVGYMAWISTRPNEIGATMEEPPTEVELLQARLDLHRIERGIDLTLAKQDQHREAERVKEAIAEALKDDKP